MIRLSFSRLNNHIVPVLSENAKSKNFLLVDSDKKIDIVFIKSLLKHYKNIVISTESILRNSYDRGGKHVNHFAGHTHISRSYLSFWNEELSSLPAKPSISDLLRTIPPK